MEHLYIVDMLSSSGSNDIVLLFHIQLFVSQTAAD